MASLNKVFIIGNLGSDPELRYTSSGNAVANFRVATSEVWNNKSGERQERTEWHRIVAWGKTAELCGEYLKKGRSAHIEGKIQTREWDDRDGNKRYTTEIVADRVTFLGGSTRMDDEAPPPTPQKQDRRGSKTRSSNFGGDDLPPLDDSDIPF